MDGDGPFQITEYATVKQYSWCVSVGHHNLHLITQGPTFHITAKR